MPNITINHAIIDKNHELEREGQPQFNIFKRSYFFVILVKYGYRPEAYLVDSTESTEQGASILPISGQMNRRAKATECGCFIECLTC